MILGFKDTFVPAVVAGTKPHSIRSGNRWRVGMSIQFYRNVRQASMTKIRENGVAKVVQKIEILRYQHGCEIIIDDRMLTPLECQELARRDGFQDLDELLRFISEMHGLPFTGQLVCWTDLKY